jgi:hypothetical protein
MSLQHQIIRQAILGPTGFLHVIECSCGRRIVRTASLKIAQRMAEYHLEVAALDEQEADHAPAL